MIRKVTCPETAHLEEIDYDVEPFSKRVLRIARCSRFSPEEAITCDRTCRDRMNCRVAAGTAPPVNDNDGNP